MGKGTVLDYFIAGYHGYAITTVVWWYVQLAGKWAWSLVLLATSLKKHSQLVMDAKIRECSDQLRESKKL